MPRAPEQPAAPPPSSIIHGPSRPARLASLAGAWLRVAGGSTATLAGSVFSRRSRARLLALARELGYDHEVGPDPILPQIREDEAVPEDVPVIVRETVERDGNVTVRELVVLNRLVAARRPRFIFEIGTFDFRTTLNLAANAAPGGRVYTLDLPPHDPRAELPMAEHDAKYVGHGARNARPVAAAERERITALHGDSATFDFSQYAGKMELVFVDGAHSREYVRHDSEIALALGTPDAAIVWHDYGVWPGVTGALNELFLTDARFSRLRWICGTTLVLLDLRHRLDG